MRELTVTDSEAHALHRKNATNTGIIPSVPASQQYALSALMPGTHNESTSLCEHIQRGRKRTVATLNVGQPVYQLDALLRGP